MYNFLLPYWYNFLQFWFLKEKNPSTNSIVILTYNFEPGFMIHSNPMELESY